MEAYEEERRSNGTQGRDGDEVRRRRVNVQGGKEAERELWGIKRLAGPILE